VGFDAKIVIGRMGAVCLLVLSSLSENACHSGSIEAGTRQKPVISGIVSKCASESDFSLRLFYAPPNMDLFPYPLVFRKANAAVTSPKPSTEFIRDVGFVVYLSTEEITDLLDRVLAWNLRWVESNTPADLRLSRPPDPPTVAANPFAMEIIATCNLGSARAFLADKRICPSLAEIDRVSQRALVILESKRFRSRLGCAVPKHE
jgi:hypothetical protein